jgi:hypothetical protein
MLLDYCLRIFCRGNMFTESLPSSERLFWLHCCGCRASCHNIFSLTISVPALGSTHHPILWVLYPRYSSRIVKLATHIRLLVRLRCDFTSVRSRDGAQHPPFEHRRHIIYATEDVSLSKQNLDRFGIRHCITYAADVVIMLRRNKRIWKYRMILNYFRGSRCL